MKCCNAVTWWFVMSNLFCYISYCQGMYLCDSTVSLTRVGQTGTMYSPNFPHDYAANLQCQYKFANNLKDEKVLRLCFRFTQFFTEDGFTDQLILINWGQMGNVSFNYNGKTRLENGPQTVRKSDMLIPSNLFDSPLCLNIQPQSKPLTFVFVSDSTKEFTGFVANYETFEAFDITENGALTKGSCPIICDRYRNSPNGTEICDCLSQTGLAPPCDVKYQFTCLNQRCVEDNTTCQAVDGTGNVCGHADWFSIVDSGNTYERARCRGKTFGCNFDDSNGFCGHIKHENSNTVLIRRVLQLNVNEIPPDHTQLGGKKHVYGYVSLTNSAKPNTLVYHLRTPTVGGFANQTGGPYSGDICLRFWWQSINAPLQESPTSALLVLAYDKNAASAKIVKVIYGQTKRLTLSINGKERYQWFLSEVEHKVEGPQTYFEFASFMISEKATYYIDDISLAPGPCSLSSDGSEGSNGCSFTSSWCGWSAEGGWRLVTGSSDHSCTYLPSSCNTIGGGGWLQFDEGSNQNVDLISPEQRANIDSLGPRCLTFWYRNSEGGFAGGLMITKKFVNHRISSQFVHTVSLSSTSKWKFVTITLPRSIYSDAPYRVHLNYLSFKRLDIDDIEILETPCMNLQEQMKTTISMITDCSFYGYFKCNNGRCVPNTMQCNGRNDCGDNSDEINCYLPEKLPNYSFSVGISAAAVLLLIVLGVVGGLLFERSKKRRQHVQSRRIPSSCMTPRQLQNPEITDRSCQTSMNVNYLCESQIGPPNYGECFDLSSSYDRESTSPSNPPPNYDEAMSMVNFVLRNDALKNSSVEQIADIMETAT